MVTSENILFSQSFAFAPLSIPLTSKLAFGSMELQILKSIFEPPLARHIAGCLGALHLSHLVRINPALKRSNDAHAD
jgi:hypothetical protein